MAGDGSSGRGVFARPGFLVAGGIVAALIVAAVIVIATTVGGKTTTPQAAPPVAPPTAPAATTATTTTGAGVSGSVCGLAGVALTGSVDAAPATVWRYDGVDAYPTSPTAGPGRTAPAGYHYCFQHTPTGALFAAANAVSNALIGARLSPADSGAWTSYFTGDGAYRGELISLASQASPPPASSISVVGFRLLSYTGGAATVAVAVNYAAAPPPGLGSLTYALTWQAGDWKLDATTEQPVTSGQLQNLQEYVPWKAAS